MGSGNLEVFKFAIYVFMPIFVMGVSTFPIFEKQVEALQNSRTENRDPVPTTKDELSTSIQELRKKHENK